VAKRQRLKPSDLSAVAIRLKPYPDTGRGVVVDKWLKGIVVFGFEIVRARFLARWRARGLGMTSFKKRKKEMTSLKKKKGNDVV
jgi:hypothetical protein